MSGKEMPKHYVRAAYAPDGPGALAMIDLLKEHGIDARKQGGVKDIYQIGGDVFGEEIMVAPEDLQKAQELLNQTGPELHQGIPKQVQTRRTILSLLAAGILFVILLFLRARLML